MTAPATRSTPHDSRNSNPTAAVAGLDVSTSQLATARRKMPTHSKGAGGRHLGEVQR
jgi:hypothetical protein